MGGGFTTTIMQIVTCVKVVGETLMERWFKWRIAKNADTMDG